MYGTCHATLITADMRQKQEKYANPNGKVCKIPFWKRNPDPIITQHVLGSDDASESI